MLSRLALVNKVNKQNQLHAIENSSLYFKMLMTFNDYKYTVATQNCVSPHA